jgi:Calcium binding
MTCQDVDASSTLWWRKENFVAQGSEDDDDFDQRLSFEIIPDAHDAEEQSLGWFSYLEEHLPFPFQAECVAERPTSPLRLGEQVNVVGLPAEDVCEHEMFVSISWQDRSLAVPLAQLTGVDVDEEVEQAIQDWHTWVDRGYKL